MFARRFALLGGLALSQWKRYALAVFAVLFSVSVSFVTPLVLAEVIDAIIGRNRPLALPEPLLSWVNARGGVGFLANNLWLMALALLLLNVLGGALQYMRGRMTSTASETIAKDLRDRLYSHLQKLSFDYHQKNMTGDLIQRCTSDVDTVRQFLSAQMVEIFRTVFMVVVATVLMLNMNPKMTAVSMILVLPLFLFAYIFFHYVQKLFLIADEAEGKMGAVLQENLAGVRVVRAFARQQYEVEKFKDINVELFKKSVKLNDLLAVYWSSADCLSMIQVCITLCYGVYMAAHGEITVGDMTVFVSYSSMLLWPVRQLGRILSDFGRSLVSMGRLDEILRQPAESEDDDCRNAPIDRDIEYRHVGFQYDGGKVVLKDLSFSVKKGQTVAILGSTGSGKSTMMLLLQRLYEVQEGEILIGGVNINKIKKEHLRSHIGLILQEPFLYSRTIKRNIGIAREDDLPDEELFDAARIAHAHEFIQEFDNGYETLVGERGVTLSGGQMQRTAIARTLLKRNDILVFDDSLSAVDTETDALIREALKRKSAGLTTFIISHRLTTLMDADLILVLKDGAIAQQGTHDKLIAEDGLYKQIYAIQTALEEELEADAS